MRKWYKYFLDNTKKGIIHKKVDESYEEHALAIGGYNPDESYTSKESFLNKYYFGKKDSRHEYYNDFLTKNLKESDKILSIGSGRCINELLLINQGFHIVCSDLGEFPAINETKKIFPGFEYIKLNILKTPVYGEFGSIICLSLVFLFNNDEIDLFFKNVSDSLKNGGTFILDSAGAPDNFSSFFIYEILAKYEAYVIRFLKSLAKETAPALIIKHQGYLRSDKDIISAASKYGLALKIRKDYGFNEFRRSYTLSKLVKEDSILERAFIAWGKTFPYARMFQFVKC